LTLSLLGILAATLSKSKAVGSVLMMVFLAACGVSMMWMVAMGQMSMRGFGGFGSSDEFLVIMGLLSAASFFTLFWLHGLAVATISHQEENGMLRVRWAVLSCALFIGVAPLIMMNVVPVTPVRFLFQLNSMGLMVLGVLNVPLLTESVGMRVRCRHELQSGSWRRPFSWLFLPGGGTAYLLFLIQILIVAIPTTVYLVSSASGSSLYQDVSIYFENGLGGLLATLGVVLACTGVPAAFAARESAPLWLRNSLRFFILTLPFWIVILLGIVELLFQITGAGFLDSALNPFIAIGDNFRNLRRPEAIAFWVALAGFGSVPMLMHAARQRAEIQGLRKAAASSSETPALAASAVVPDDSTEPVASLLEEEPEA
jgi:hypothetical protein